MNTSPLRLRTAEAAKYTDRPEATLRWLRATDKGPRSYKLGRTVFYDIADLDAWIAAEKASTARGGVA